MAQRQPDTSAYRSRQFLLTRNEREFFHALHDAFGRRWSLFAKVRLADVITCPESEWNREAGRRIAQKHLDFVVCHPRSMRIIAAIELDDRSHETARRRRRDSFLDRAFENAGVPLLRHKAQSSYDAETLRTAWVDSIFGAKPCAHATDRNGLTTRRRKGRTSHGTSRIPAWRRTRFTARKAFNHCRRTGA